MNDLPLRPAADIGAVEDRSFTLRNFPLTDGTVMPEATIAYETYGRLAPPNGPNGGRNAILCTHGYTGSHHFAGRNPANGNQPGSWDGLIGPGKAIDTEKLFVVASNMLGSSFGSTNAGNINPQTGEAYGPDFPNITIRDIVAAQKALLDHLGVRHLVAVAGPSYGGYQAFQWAELQARLASDPEWHGGRYYGKAACKTVLTEIRVETLKRYGIETALTPRLPDPAAREAAIREQAANWAAKWDANSLIILRRALLGFDTRPDFARIKAKVLYILCRTDALFPPKIAPDVIKALTAAGVEARYFELDSDLGHSSSGAEHAKWSPVLREFLAPLVARLN
jgi:homoserine O-acetyltransferase